jgi:hypothetical protein
LHRFGNRKIGFTSSGWTNRDNNIIIINRFEIRFLIDTLGDDNFSGSLDSALYGCLANISYGSFRWRSKSGGFNVAVM